MLDKIYKIISSFFEASSAKSLSVVVTSSSERSIVESSRVPSAEEMAQQEHRAAEELIRMFPKSAEGYLASGYLHEQQDNFRAALIVYNQGLQSLSRPRLPCSDTLNDYIRLEKAKRKALNVLMKRIDGFLRIFPYDILSQIFENLRLHDLLQCAGVCRSWFDYILDWQEFWQKVALEIPKTNRSTLELLLRRQTQEFRLNGPVAPDLVDNLLLFLAEKPSKGNDNNSILIRTLIFTNIHLSHIGMALLQRTLRSIGQALKQVEFINCTLQENQIMDFISSSCSKATHVSFSQSLFTNPSANSTTLYSNSNVDDNRTASWFFSRTTKRITATSPLFKSLTHLDISGDFHYFEPMQQTSPLIGILSQCPNLTGLTLSSGVAVNHTHCIIQVLNYCPKLRYLSMCNKIGLKPTIATDEYKNSITGDLPSSTPEYITGNFSNQQNQPSSSCPNCSPPLSPLPANKHQSTAAPDADGLRWLILGNTQNIEQSNFSMLLSRSHKTLEFLYLRCNFSRKVFTDLVTCGGPQLREINLSMIIYGGTQQELKNALITLFSRCSVLEVITLDNSESGRVYCSSQFHSLVVDDDILFAIAKNCPLLRQLHVTGSHSHSTMGLFGFAAATKRRSRLAYLEIEIIYKSHLLELVQDFKSLKTLHMVFSKSRTLPEGYGIPSDHLERLEQILRERGGALILDLH